ncbi:MAG: hypothetical protein ACYCT1_20040 [Steroidobacteraceae bacterium]
MESLLNKSEDTDELIDIDDTMFSKKRNFETSHKKAYESIKDPWEIIEQQAKRIKELEEQLKVAKRL